MTAPAAGSLIQNTRRPWAIDITTAVDPITGQSIDLTTVTSVSLFVHRGVLLSVAPAGTSTETWTTAIDVTYKPATATTLRAINTPTGSGVGSVTIADEALILRPILSFASGPSVECSRFFLSVKAE